MRKTLGLTPNAFLSAFSLPQKPKINPPSTGTARELQHCASRCSAHCHSSSGLHSCTLCTSIKFHRRIFWPGLSSGKPADWLKITKIFGSSVVIMWKRLTGVQGDNSSLEWLIWGKLFSTTDLIPKFQWPEKLLVGFGFLLLSWAKKQDPKVRWDKAFSKGCIWWTFSATI